MAALSPTNPKDKNGFYLCPKDNSEDECQTPTDASGCCGSYTSTNYGGMENVCSSPILNAVVVLVEPTFSFKCNGGLLYEKILPNIFMGIMLYINIWKDRKKLFKNVMINY